MSSSFSLTVLRSLSLLLFFSLFLSLPSPSFYVFPASPSHRSRFRALFYLPSPPPPLPTSRRRPLFRGSSSPFPPPHAPPNSRSLPCPRAPLGQSITHAYLRVCRNQPEISIRSRASPRPSFHSRSPRSILTDRSTAENDVDTTSVTGDEIPSNEGAVNAICV